MIPVRSTGSLLVATLLAVLALTALADESLARAPRCAAFDSQAAAQARFLALGGGPRRNLGGMDGDGDGVACEQLPGPHAGYATIGYNERKRFLYGFATMPSNDSGDGFACLQGNTHFPEGPRLLKVFRALQGPDRAVSGDIGAAASPGSDRIVWKLDRRVVPRGRYYAEFEQQQPLGPYRPSECPSFRSRATLLPALRPG